MIAPARAVTAGIGAVAAAAVLGFASCRDRTAPVPPEYPLAPAFDQAEIRSDGFDLAFLVRSGAFRWPGWGDAIEENGRTVVWSLAEDASLELPVATPAPRLLTLRARCHASLGPRLPLTLSLGGRPLAELELTPQETEFSIALPPDVLAHLAFRVPRRYLPPKGQRDERPAAVGIGGLSVSRVGRAAAQALPTAEAGVLSLPPASSVAYFLRLGVGARLSLRANALGPGRIDARLATTLANTDLGPRELMPNVDADLEWPLSVAAGTYARVEIRNSGESILRIRNAGISGLAAVGAAPPPPARLPDKPSLVVFLTDTLRADRLSTYGFEKATSPNLDAFAREAVVFDDAWAQSSWTRPTVASLFTGLNPASHGAVGFERPLAQRFTTLAEVLQQSGYRTGAVVSNHVVHHRFGFAQGFGVWNDGEAKLYGLPAAQVVERGLRFVDAGEGPFLLYLHTMEPHATYEPSDEAYRLFGPPGEARRPSRPILMRPKIKQGAARYLDALYQGEVWDNDRAFGSLIEGLRRRGRLESTVVVFTADHGEEFLDHGDKGHGHSLYRELTRVPLVVRLPAAARGGTREAYPVAQVDVLPTLLGLLGAGAPRHEGRDLSGAFLGKGRPQGEALLVGETRFGKSEKQSLRVGDLKLVLNHDPRRYGSGGGPSELYDLARDPGERDDLARKEWIAAAWMERRLRFLLDTWRRSARAPTESVEITDEDREALRALGYVN